jgi:hypothetical protein
MRYLATVQTVEGQFVWHIFVPTEVADDTR